MKDRILDRLAGIEQDRDVRILHAVESGSRAWGFASENSDYDVRFIYIHKPAWYLSIQCRQDVIDNLPDDDRIDVSGWDIRKALQLFRKSNPPLLEWLNSPTVYLDRQGFADELRDLAEEYFSPRACTYHYLHMAQGNYRDYLQGETVRLKKYFYVIRPLLACRWTERHQEQPPIEMSELMTMLKPSLLKRQIEDLLQRKRKGEELDEGERIDVVNEFIETEIAHFELAVKGANKSLSDSAWLLNRLFRKMLANVYIENWKLTIRRNAG